MLSEFRATTSTLGNQDRDFTEWHNGRSYYYVWAVMIADPAWKDSVRRAGIWLERYLVPAYQRQPHITLLPAGFVDSEPPRTDAVSSIAADVAAFDLRLGQLSSFTSSPCFEVQDSGDRLRQLRIALRGLLVDPDSVVSDEAYRPHLTTGLYRDQFPTAAIADRIELFEPACVAPFRVTGFSLARYDTRTIKGSIDSVLEVDLGTGDIRGYHHMEPV